jgi:hypothetical protein
LKKELQGTSLDFAVRRVRDHWHRFQPHGIAFGLCDIHWISLGDLLFTAYWKICPWPGMPLPGTGFAVI